MTSSWYNAETVTCRPYNASEVFVTGNFDDWGKTVKLDRVGDIFIKEVTISPVQKVQYKVWRLLFFFFLLISRTFTFRLYPSFPSVDWMAVSLRQQGHFH